MSTGGNDWANCSLCDRAADPRMGVYTSCGAYPLCDGCSPASNQADVDRVAAACIARNPSGDDRGRPRFAMTRIQELLSRICALEAEVGGGGALSGGVETTFVFRPGGVAALNVYTTEAALIAAVTAVSGPLTVEIDTSLAPAIVTIPWTFRPANGPQDVTIVGYKLATLLSGSTGSITGVSAYSKMLLRGTGVAPVVSTAVAMLVQLFDSAVTTTGAAAFFESTASTLELELNGASQIVKGAGAMVVRANGAGATVPIVQYDDSSIAKDTLAEAAGGAVTVAIESPAFAIDPRQAGVVGGVVKMTTKLSELPVRPIGGGADDSARLNALASIGATIVLSAKTYTAGVVDPDSVFIWAATATSTPPKSTWLGQGIDATEIKGTFAQVGLDSAIFSGLGTYVGPLITFQANNVQGSDTVNLTQNPLTIDPTATELLLRQGTNGLEGSIYDIVSVTVIGAGNFAVRLDRPVVYAFTAAEAGTSAQIHKNTMRGIRVSDMTLTVVGGAQTVEVSSGRDNTFERVRHKSATVVPASILTFDVGSFNCKLIDNLVEGPATNVQVWVTGETHTLQNVIGTDDTNATPIGLLVANCVGGNVFRGCDFSGFQTANVDISTDDVAGGGVPIYPSTGCRFEACTFNGSVGGGGGRGVAFQRGSNDMSFVDCQIRFNVTGVVINAGTAPDGSIPISGCTFVGCDMSQNTNSAVIDSADTIGSTFTGCDMSGGGANGATLTGQSTWSDVVVNGGNPAAVFRVYGTADVSVTNFFIRTTIANTSVFQVENTAKLRTTMGRFIVDAAAVLYNLSGACEIDTSHQRATGAGAGATAGYNINAPGTVRIGAGVDFQSLVVPANFGAGAFISRSSAATGGGFGIVANGAVAVATAWPKIRATDVVSYVAAPGGAGATSVPTVVITPGVGFAGTFQAGDLNNYDYIVN